MTGKPDMTNKADMTDMTVMIDITDMTDITKQNSSGLSRLKSLQLSSENENSRFR